MSTGGGPLLGEGGFFGAGRNYGSYGPRGPYGPWAGCGCSSIIIFLALILLACGGFLRMLDF